MAHTPRRISIVNQKGGVGKTTTTANVAAVLGSRGLKTLCIDYDPQANLTQFFGRADVFSAPETYGSYDFTMGKTPFVPLRDVLPGVDLLPGTEALSFIDGDLLAEITLKPLFFRLATALEQVEQQYDYVLVDCGPTFSNLTANAILACPEVLIPIELQWASVPGAQHLSRRLEALRAHDPDIRILGVLGTKKPNNAARSPQQVLIEVRKLFGEVVFDTQIALAQAVADAAADGRPVFLSKPGHPGAVQYDLLTQEIIARG